MDSQLVVLHFDDEDDARAALSSVWSLADKGFVALEDAAVVTRADDGTVTAQGATGSDRGATAVGAILGAVGGALVGLPVLGIAVGTGITARHLAAHAERLDELLFTVGRDMAAGTAVLTLLVSAVDDPQVVTDRLERHRGAVTRIDVSDELKAHIAEASP